MLSNNPTEMGLEQIEIDEIGNSWVSKQLILYLRGMSIHFGRPCCGSPPAPRSKRMSIDQTSIWPRSESRALKQHRVRSSISEGPKVWRLDGWYIWTCPVQLYIGTWSFCWLLDHWRKLKFRTNRMALKRIASRQFQPTHNYQFLQLVNSSTQPPDAENQ